MKRELHGIYRLVSLLLFAAGIALSVVYIFHFSPFGLMLFEFPYLFGLFACFITPAFLFYPASKNSPRDRIPWYDTLLALFALGIFGYFASTGLTPSQMGWEFMAPVPETILIGVGLLLILEASRRTTGKAFTIVCAAFMFFPLFANRLPGMLEGVSYSFPDLIRFMGFSREGLLGIATRSVGQLVIGFIIFGIAIIRTGAGQFFIDIANALFGDKRGGPAKVAVVSSAAFGTLSGSVLSNVLATGSITIPTSKKAGYPAEFAAATEAVASTGGALMPPVMGAAAFIMAEFLAIPYAQVVVAAIIPSILYYLALFVQLDSYAAVHDLKGLPRAELPLISKTFKEGWIYILAFLLLIYFLIYLRLEAMAPYYATAALLALALVKKSMTLHPRDWVLFLGDAGLVLTELAVTLGAVGFIIGALSMTGIGVGLASGMVDLTRGNLIPLLILGAATSGVLGMGMTAVPCYVFLAVTVAPALIQLGVYPIAAHLFVMYWGLISFITPPVALAAIAAAGIAGTSPVRTGFRAMRLGIGIYLVPFFFTIDPSLILHGSVLQVVPSVFTGLIGITMIGQSFEGYLMGVGKLNHPARVILFTSGVLLLAPGWQADALGAIIIALTVVLIRLYRWRQRGTPVQSTVEGRRTVGSYDPQSKN